MKRRNRAAVRLPMRRTGTLLLLGNASVLASALAGGFLAFLSAYALEGDRGPLMAACCALAVMSLALWSLPRGSYSGALGLLAVGGLAAWWKWELLGPALGLVGARLRDAWSRLGTAGSGETIKWSVYPGAEQGLPAVLLLLAALLALILGWAVVRVRRWWLVLAVTLLPLLPAILAGVLPSWRPLMAALAAVLALMLTGLYSQRDQAALGRGLLLSMTASVLLLMVMNAAMPREGYTRPQWATNAKDRLSDAALEGFETVLDWEIPGVGSGAGPSVPDVPGAEDAGPAADSGGAVYAGSGTVDLTAAGPRHYTGRTVLQVEGEESGRVYLRGSSVVRYTGTSWEPASEDVYAALGQTAAASLLFPAQTAPDGEVRTMTIRPVSMLAGVVYTPYQLLELPDGGTGASGDVGLFQSSPGDYQISYRPASLDTAEPAPLLSEAEESYRRFAGETYLAVPPEVRSRLSPLLEDMDRQAIVWPQEFPAAYQEPLAQARRAAALLASLAVYDLDTPAMEAGGDFVEHFLTQGRGYCVHFATAGALLLRLKGIPARYVSGYVAYLDQSGRAIVRDSSAHAWVEIYLNGYGWYPVEMTPAYLGEDGEIPRDEPLPEPESPAETPDQPEEAAPDPVGNEAAAKGTDLRWFLWVILTAALLGALAAPRLLARELRRRAMERPDTGRSAIAAYRWYRRLLPWGGAEEPELEELGGKAAFSQHTLTEEERQTAWACAQRAALAVEARLPRWKRLAFRWLWLLG